MQAVYSNLAAVVGFNLIAFEQWWVAQVVASRPKDQSNNFHLELGIFSSTFLVGKVGKVSLIRALKEMHHCLCCESLKICFVVLYEAKTESIRTD